jgi:hypothetical protein
MWQRANECEQQRSIILNREPAASSGWVPVVLLMLAMVLWPSLSDARCRTVGESASLGTQYGTFPLYPAERVVEAGQKRESVPLQWVGYGIGLPLFVVAMPFAMVGAGVGAILHPWTKCIASADRATIADSH